MIRVPLLFYYLVLIKAILYPLIINMTCSIFSWVSYEQKLRTIPKDTKEYCRWAMTTRKMRTQQGNACKSVHVSVFKKLCSWTGLLSNSCVAFVQPAWKTTQYRRPTETTPSLNQLCNPTGLWLNVFPKKRSTVQNTLLQGCLASTRLWQVCVLWMTGRAPVTFLMRRLPWRDDDHS